MLKLSSMAVGPVRANCYLIYDENKKALIVDPGGDPDLIKEEIQKLELEPLVILLTHAHYDHIGAVDEIRDDYQLEVYISSEEQVWLGNPKLNLSAGSTWMPEVTARPAEHEFEPYKNYQMGNFSFIVLPTPGHSPGSVSFLFEDEAFVLCGDALFNGTIGRTDLPQADLHTLKNSIRRELFTLPGHFTAYPGHGTKTTIEKEKKTNPFFN